MALEDDLNEIIVGETEEEFLDLQQILRDAIDDAEDYIDSEIAPDRIRNAKAYRGEPYGDEEEGRSQAISMDVRDTVSAVLPALMRTFFGSEKRIEFLPFGEEDIDIAEQATDYINRVVIQIDNPGYIIFRNWIKDGLVRRVGFAKWWWDDTSRVEITSHTGLTEQQVLFLQQEGEVIDLAQDGVIDHITPEGAVQLPTFSFLLRRTAPRGRARFDAVPPEEVIVSRAARSLQEAELVSHRYRKGHSELLSMGFSPEELAGHQTRERETNEEKIDREGPAKNFGHEAIEDQYDVWESYLRVDLDGDGFPELNRIFAIGEEYSIIGEPEPVSALPFAGFCPDPEPHTVFRGFGVADVVRDIQRIKTSLARLTLDSFALSVHPRLEVVDGQVNMADVMNSEIGAVYRSRAPNMIRPIAVPFIGKEGLTLMQFYDSVREARTGTNQESEGLNAKDLQSSTQDAVQDAVTARRARIEETARVFAETGLKELYGGLLRLIVENQDFERMVRLSGRSVPINPASWDAEMDMVVNVPLGAGLPEQRIRALSMVKQAQEQVFQLLGPTNPLVSAGQYAKTLRDMVEISGLGDASQYFKPVSRDFEIPPPPEKPAPEEILAQAQLLKVQSDAQNAQARLELQREEMVLDNQMERDRLDADIRLGSAKIEVEEEKVDVQRSKT